MNEKCYTVGVDIGSTASKAVILENGKDIVGKALIPVGTGSSGPQKVMEELWKTSGIKREEVSYLVATGYGRIQFPDADKQISELSCHAKGISYMLPDVNTVLDIGGQDVKVLRIDRHGNLVKFVMNDKCAAGTGRFLDAMARVLETEVSQFSNLDKQAENPVTISSVCTVFAESELISHLSHNEKKADIIAGIHNSVAQRCVGLISRVGIKPELAVTGGVAKNTGVVRALEDALHQKVAVPTMPQYTGALGAALLGWRQCSA